MVKLSVGDASARFAVETKSAVPYVAHVPRLDADRDRLRRLGNPLLYAPRVSEGQGRALTERGWSWIDELGNFDLRAEGIVLRNRIPRKKGEGKRSAKALPTGSVGLRVIRTLIANPPEPIRTSTLAAAAGTSAPRTSQVLQQLRTHGHAARASNSTWDVDRAALLELFLADYRGPGGDRRWFYALDLASAARAIVEHRECEPVISGDVAADLLAPRRRPSHLVAYVRHGEIEESDVLVATTSGSEANIAVIQPSDRSVFPLAPLHGSGATGVIPLAEVTQVAWDLLRLGGQDRLEQIEELKAWILRSR